MMRNVVFYNEKIPLSILKINLSEVHSFFDKEIKLLFILNGKISMITTERSYELQESDVYIINRYENVTISNLHSIPSSILEISIDTFEINKIFPEFSDYLFWGNSKLDKENVNYEKLKKKISEIMISCDSFKDSIENYELNIKISKLCYFLINSFKISENTENSKKNKSIYIKNIIDYLEKNYRNENLNVDEVSDYLGLSSHYVLKIFKENIGTGLIDYLNMLRINHSINSLLTSEKSILEIAIDFGFNNSKTFSRTFKKYYNLSPGEYKKSSISTRKVTDDLKVDDDLLIKQFIEEYLNKNQLDENLKSKEIVPIEIDLKKINEIKIDKYWNKVLALGKAFEGLKGEIKYQIEEITSEIDFEYIKINNIFSDELFIYNEEETGIPYYNFAYIDKLIDYFISLNLKPYINIGFTPKKLKSADQYVLSSNVSYPNDISKWLQLIENLFNHFYKRYGNRINSWKFEIWNNPDGYKNFWYESDDKFFEFFRDTYKTIKKVSNEIKIGGPTIIITENMSYLFKFIDFMDNNHVKLDFLSFHYYNIKSFSGSVNQVKWNIKYYDYIDYKNLTKNYIKFIEEKYKRNFEIYISEWNSSPYYKDLTHDTCFMNTFIIDSISNNFNLVESMSYWTLIESRLGSDLFHGGFGLFTVDNLKKSSYNTFVLINKLGDKLIKKDKNYIITRKENSYQILLYNHLYYNEKYQSGNFEDIDSINRYDIFDKGFQKEIIINLNNLPTGNYLIKKHYLNKSSGSVYDAWKEMGAPQKLSKEIYEYLKAKEKMKLHFNNIFITERLNIKEILEDHEVIFISLEKE
ncbi:MAG: helix-turn-helix domain-containing protein [Fusobacteriaceae bacterium]|nr:helix-turn-helix domain-containing protein [Fusobacteriaceae bacterium]